jgi:hypothetical protein
MNKNVVGRKSTLDTAAYHQQHQQQQQPQPQEYQQQQQ